MIIEALDWKIIWPVWVVRDSRGRAVFYCEDLSAAKAYMAGRAGEEALGRIETAKPKKAAATKTKLTQAQLDILTEVMNTNDGAMCVLIEDVGQPHLDLQALGAVILEDIELDGAWIEIRIDVTERGVKLCGEASGTSEEDIKKAVESLNDGGRVGPGFVALPAKG